MYQIFNLSQFRNQCRLVKENSLHPLSCFNANLAYLKINTGDS
jgi:hypothetical protein